MTIEDLKAKIEAEVRKGEISLDEEVYQEANKDPHVPILFGGKLTTPVAFFARDLGRQEVLRGEPLIGDAGQRVRKGVYKYLFGALPLTKDIYLEEAVQQIMLTNTVPYKPVGNKAYPTAVKERFRPYVAELLACHFQGNYIITMGTEAFEWFAPYSPAKEAATFWKRPDKFEAEFACTLKIELDGQTIEKHITLAPLPHPSPLNQTYLKIFPELLTQRLGQSPLLSLNG